MPEHSPGDVQREQHHQHARMSRSMSTDESPDNQNTNQRLDALEGRLDGLNELIEFQDDVIEDQSTRIAELEQTVDNLEHEFDQYRRQVEATMGELEQRTDLLKDANASSASTAELRAAKLVQKLADKGERKNADRVWIDAKEGWTTLNYEPDRTTVYDYYEKAESLVGRPDVLYYKKEDRSAQKPSRLVFDQTAGDLPGVVAGTEIKACGASTTSQGGEGAAEKVATPDGGQAQTD